MGWAASMGWVPPQIYQISITYLPNIYRISAEYLSNMYLASMGWVRPGIAILRHVHTPSKPDHSTTPSEAWSMCTLALSQPSFEGGTPPFKATQELGVMGKVNPPPRSFGLEVLGGLEGLKLRSASTCLEARGLGGFYRKSIEHL